jgi:hypothetical protein
MQRLLDENNHKKNYDSLMSLICKDTSGLDFSEEVLADSNFRYIYEHSDAYLEDAIKILAKDSFTNKQASICIFEMQNLSVIDYVSFCEFYVKLFKAGKIPEGMLQQAIVPNFLQKRIIPENYSDPNVIGLLRNITSNKSVSTDFKMLIGDIQSGKYIKGVRNSPNQ